MVIKDTDLGQRKVYILYEQSLSGIFHMLSFGHEIEACLSGSWFLSKALALAMLRPMPFVLSSDEVIKSPFSHQEGTGTFLSYLHLIFKSHICISKSVFFTNSLKIWMKDWTLEITMLLDIIYISCLTSFFVDNLFLYLSSPYFLGDGVFLLLNDWEASSCGRFEWMGHWTQRSMDPTGLYR